MIGIQEKYMNECSCVLGGNEKFKVLWNTRISRHTRIDGSKIIMY